MSDRRLPQPDKLASTPLPPGWEAKYDYMQKRYFFIDHQTKQTTWVDPRLKQQQHPPHSAVSQVGTEHKSARHSPKPAGQHGKSTASVGWQTQVEDKYGMKVEIIKDDGNDVDPEATNRIMLRFPTVGKELVTLVSADCSSEEEVCQKLRDMGYREDKQASISTSGRTASFGSKSQSHNEKLTKPTVTGPSPSFGTKSPSHNEKLTASSGGGKAPPYAFPIVMDPSNVSPIPKQHSKKSSPERASTPKNAGQNNAGDRRSASPARPSKGKGSGHKSHTAGGQNSAKASPLAELSTDKKRRLQEKLEQEFKNQEKSIVESTLTSCSYDEEKARFELQLLSITKSSSDTTNATTTTLAPSIGANGSESNKMNSTAAAAAAAAVSSPTTDAHESSNGSSLSEHLGYASSRRLETTGANASLAKGPNKELLLSDYLMDVGSQSSYCHGPCKENYHGPSADLRKGHQAGLDKGPACLYSVSSE